MPCAALPGWLEFTQENHHCFCDYPEPSGHRSVPEWILWSAWKTGPPLISVCHLQGSCLQTATKRIEWLASWKTSACSKYVCELYLNAKRHKSMTFQEELDPSYPVSFAKSLSLVSFVLAVIIQGSRLRLQGTDCFARIFLVVRGHCTNIYKWKYKQR